MIDQRGKTSERKILCVLDNIAAPRNQATTTRYSCPAELYVRDRASLLTPVGGDDSCVSLGSCAVFLLLVVTELEETPFLPLSLMRILNSYYGLKPMV